VELTRRDFSDKQQLADALADAVAGNLKAGVASRGAASLAVSGGSTPARFFKALSERADVPWDKVTVTLVDERWVDEASDRSNGRLVKANLLKGRAILGMGNDGHTASFFPGGDSLAEALTTEGPVVAIQAPGAGEPRVTLTLKVLLASKALYLHIEGEEKVATLRLAEAEGPVEAMPVRAILRQTQTPLTVYWCP
jgi:6-phosphogluconolactonase